MTVEEQLKAEILRQYKSIAAFTSAIGVPNSTLNSVFKRGISNAGVGTMVKVFTTLGLDLESIQDGHLRPSDIKKAPSLSGEDLKIMRDYNGLDDHGKTMARMVISEEQKRMDAEAEAKAKATETTVAPVNIIPFAPKKKTTHQGIVTLEVYEEPSAAGLGNYVSDAPASHMEQYPEEYVPSRTDFGLVVSGQSMEPKYPNGSVVFIQSTQVVEPGEVGIFIFDGQSYIKELQINQETGAAFLHSLNLDYDDIEIVPNIDFRPQGKVLGGFDPASGKVIWK